MDMYQEYEAERLAAMNTPEAMARDAVDAAKRIARALARPEPVAAPEPVACDMCGDDLDDGECPSCDA